MNAVVGVREPSARYIAAALPAPVLHLEELASAPGGVARLRDLILTLAVRGKLTLQLPSDDSVAALLRQIPAAMSAPMKSGKATQAAGSEAVVGRFDIPGPWAWVALGHVTKVSGGVTLGRKSVIHRPLTLPYLRVANVQRWRVLCDDLKAVTIAEAELPRYQLRAGDLLITEGGDWDKVGRTAVWRDEVPVCLHQNHVFKVRGVTSSWNPAWAELYLNSPDARAYFASCSKQTTNLASINMTQLKACAFPLPPLAEQARIVARVDELMRLCDALEAKGRLEAEQHARLLDTLLGTLTDSATPEELAANWQRVAVHFDLLLDRPEAVDALEQTILQLAVRGMLVAQDPTEDAAEQLVVGISKANAASFPSRPLPVGWAWVQLGQVAESRLGKMLDKGKNVGTLRPYLRNTNVQWRRFELADIKLMRFEESELDEFRLAAGDLLICEGGEPGRCAIWRDNAMEMYFQKAIHRVRPAPGISADYVAMALEGDAVSGALADYFTGATIKHFVGQALERYVFPLPPVAEQARIVARVTELRHLCATLRARLAAQQTVQSHLADAIVEQALA